jgi:hypothetical protein
LMYKRKSLSVGCRRLITDDGLRKHRQKDLNMPRWVKMGRRGPAWPAAGKMGVHERTWARVGVAVTTCDGL